MARIEGAVLYSGALFLALVLAATLLMLGILEAQILSTEVTIGLVPTQHVDLDSDGKTQDISLGNSAMFDAIITIGAEAEQIEDVLIEFRPKSGEGPVSGPHVKFRAHPENGAVKLFDDTTRASTGPENDGMVDGTRFEHPDAFAEITVAFQDIDTSATTSTTGFKGLTEASSITYRIEWWPGECLDPSQDPCDIANTVAADGGTYEVRITVSQPELPDIIRTSEVTFYMAEEVAPTPTNVAPSYFPPTTATPTPTSISSPTLTPTPTPTSTPTMTPSPMPTQTATATPRTHVTKTPQGPSGLEGIITQLDSLSAASILENVSPKTAAPILSRMPADRLAEVARQMDEGRLTERLDQTFAVADLAVSPSEAHPGEEVTITVNVTNTSSNASVYPAILRIDNTIVQTQTVEVGADQTRRIVFTLTKTEGHYKISLHGLSHQLTVVSPTATPLTAATPPTAKSTATPTRTASPTATPVPTQERGRPPHSVVSPTPTVTPTSPAAVSATATPSTSTPIPTAYATVLPTQLPTVSPTPTLAATPAPPPVDEGEIGPPIIIILILIGFAAVGLAVSLYLGQRG